MLLDCAVAKGRETPTWGDRLDLAGNGLVARVECAFDPSSRPFRARLAALAHLTLAAIAAFSLVYGELIPRLACTGPTWVCGRARLGPGVGPVVWALWLLPFALGLLRREGAARMAALLATVVPVPLIAVAMTFQWARPPMYILVLVTLLGLLSILAAPATSSLDRRVLAAVAVLFCVSAAVTIGPWRSYQDLRTFYRRGGLSGIGMLFTMMSTVLAALAGAFGAASRSCELRSWSRILNASLVFWWCLLQASRYAGPSLSLADLRWVVACEIAVLVLAGGLAWLLRKLRREYDLKPTSQASGEGTY